MKKHRSQQSVESFHKTPRFVAAILVAGVVGLACSTSDKGDGGAAGWSQVGAGGVGGTNDSGGGGAGGQSGTSGPVPTCNAYPGYSCNPGDHEVGISFASYYGDQWDCPAERECYSLGGNCGSILCVLPVGVHCSDSPLCNPGDTQIPLWGPACVGWPSPCYTKQLCAQQSSLCRLGTDAVVDAGGPDAPLSVGVVDIGTVGEDSGVDQPGGSVGVPCDDLAPSAGPSQAVFDYEALECQSRICVKPAVQAGVAETVSTTAYCTKECVQDSDCDGQARDQTNPSDTRCRTGFVCGIEFAVGPLCCMRLCVCKDFLGQRGMPTPAACAGDAAASCH